MTETSAILTGGHLPLGSNPSRKPPRLRAKAFFSSVPGVDEPHSEFRQQLAKALVAQLVPIPRRRTSCSGSDFNMFSW